MSSYYLIDTFIRPSWPAPTNVQAFQSTRLGGFSTGRYECLNFGDHVNDNPLSVVKNRQLLNTVVPTEPVWLKQVHGTHVIDASLSRCIENADASYTSSPNVVCVTMTADCLPVLICDEGGTTVCAIHAGWRGLCDGVIEAAVAKMNITPARLMAWLGPCIGPTAFEVGDEVRECFVAQNEEASFAFKASQGKWLANLYLLASQRLQKIGVTAVYGGGVNEDFCTFNDEARFFSYRRDANTGRMGTFIWLSNVE